MILLSAGEAGSAFEEFEEIRRKSSEGRSQFDRDLAAGPFFGGNRPGAKIPQGLIDTFWLQGMQAGHRNTFECIKAFSEMDFTGDLIKFDLPALLIHGDDDQIVPLGASSLRSAKLIKPATLKIYRSAARPGLYPSGAVQRRLAFIPEKLSRARR